MKDKIELKIKEHGKIVDCFKGNKDNLDKYLKSIKKKYG